MKYIEKTCDLFSLSEEYWLVHCISSDFAMGKGIAVDFNKRFGMKTKLTKKYTKNFWRGYGYCLEVKGTNVFNLVTKERYWHKPTLTTMRQALIDMKLNAMDLGIKNFN